MIVDYNYKPYVYIVTAAPAATIEYTPPFKNNKGFIYFSGIDSSATNYYPLITLSTPNNTGITFSCQLQTGSFGDMFMQFKRDIGDLTPTTSLSHDITMVRGSSPLRSSFFPFTYQKITITADTGTIGLSFATAPVIITLY
jgi:hypothetical protein